jgi:hypothetical protein
MTPIRQKVALWIPYALVLLLVHCQQDGTTEPEDIINEPIVPDIIDEPISLAGKWFWSSITISSDCDNQLDSSGIPVRFEDQGESFVMRTGEYGLELTGTVSDTVVDFIRTDSTTVDTCLVIRQYTGQGAIEENLVVGILTTTIIHFDVSCDHPDCVQEEEFFLERDLDCNCPERAVFGTPASSAYKLPFPKGKSYFLSQSYCTPNGSHKNQMHYDFDMPIGSEILAARDGRVVGIRDGYSDYDRVFNYVDIQHADRSLAFYAHFTKNGISVVVGQNVKQGDLIGLSGSSGSPCCKHLHFGVYRRNPPDEGDDVAVNFNNSAGPLDACGGLVRGAIYTAK